MSRVKKCAALRGAAAAATVGLIAGLFGAVATSVPAGAEGGPTVSVADVSVAEPVKGNAKAVFEFTLSETSTVPVAVRYQTIDGTASQPGDYTKRTSTVVIPPGATSARVNVIVKSDKVPEAEEMFTLQLLSVRNGTLARESAIGMIVDGGPSGISVADAEIEETDAGSQNMVFTLSLTRQPADNKQVIVNYKTSDLTATAGDDYRAKSGTVRFPKNKNTVQVRVPVIGDTEVEGDEFFALELTAPQHAVLADGVASGHIVDND